MVLIMNYTEDFKQIVIYIIFRESVYIICISKQNMYNLDEFEDKGTQFMEPGAKWNKRSNIFALTSSSKVFCIFR